MENAISLPNPMHFGEECVPLVFVEVMPLRIEATGPVPSPISAPRVKLLLRQKSLRSSILKDGALRIFPDDEPFTLSPKSGTEISSAMTRGSLSFPVHDKTELHWACLQSSRQIVPVMYLPSENPTVVEPVPCWVIGYGVQKTFESARKVEAIITESTLVRVLPDKPCSTLGSDRANVTSLPIEQSLSLSFSNLNYVMSGESLQPPLSAQMIDEVFHNHDDETIRALSLRMSMLLKQPISIGTTADAFFLRRERQCCQRLSLSALESYLRSGADANETRRQSETPVNDRSKRGSTNMAHFALEDGMLTVHSAHHGAGKTLLVQAIAQERLKCGAIHVIQPTLLLAQYGIHADAALESLLHSIVMNSACRQKSVCIILDHLDSMLPPASSTRANAGDAALPVLKAIGSYLKALILGLKRNHEMLFPTKNALYNLAGTDGHILNANVCLVGVMTCDDDGRRPGKNGLSYLSTTLDTLGAGRYRLPPLSAQRRLAAFQNAFELLNISLDSEATNRLPILAASAVEARGQTFSDVAHCLANLTTGKDEASLHDLRTALSVVQREASSGSVVEFTDNRSRTTGENELFLAVGGNVEAKLAIEEALSLDPEKRRILRTFGLTPPTGLLLYGPPGTGKTLLAKCVAKLLKTESDYSSSVGGSFITLQASEIVRGEVGNSEKMIVSAFETARCNAPSVVFIDEFQALFTERSGSGSGKLSSTLLQCMDDAYRWRVDDDASPLDETTATSSRVVVLGATNTPWMVDKAFLRPGRFDRCVHVGLPNLEERVSILRVHVARMRLASSAIAYGERLCHALARECEGFSGADLAALCRAAGVRCLAEHGASGAIDERHFQEARIGFKPSCSTAMALRLNMWRP